MGGMKPADPATNCFIFGTEPLPSSPPLPSKPSVTSGASNRYDRSRRRIVTLDVSMIAPATYAMYTVSHWEG